jgi:hypothetical protein
MKRPCEYRDREGNRGAGCLLEFELNGGQGGSNRRHCDACQKLAARDRGAAYVTAHPEKYRKSCRDQRQKAAEAAGRDYRPMDELQPCLYRDRAKKPGPNCIGMFKPKTGGQIFCDNCRPLAVNKRQSAAAAVHYRADKVQFVIGGDPEACARHKRRLERGKKSAAAYHERQRAELAALRKQAVFGKIFEKLKNKPVSWRLIVMLKLLDPALTKADLRKFGGEEANLSGRQMTRILDQIKAWMREFSPTPRAKTPRPEKPVN